MARRFAGTMGVLGMVVTLLRGAFQGGSPADTILISVAALFVLAAVGALVGAIAQQTVDESVRRRLEKVLAKEAAAEDPAPQTAAR